MSKLVYIPLENMEQRYSAMMNNAIADYADEVLYPEFKMSGIIETGEFLDTNKTCIFKAKQLQMIAAMFYAGAVKNGTKFLFADMFFPGMEMIKYMAELQGITVKVYGFNYAGRADNDDFTVKLGKWADRSEHGWHLCCDKVFVGSEYHRERVMKHFAIKNIYTTGYIWDRAYVDGVYQSGQDDKQPFVIFPHRLAAEKGIDELIKFAETTDKKIIVTSSGAEKKIKLPKNIEYRWGLSKAEYYKIMARAKWYLSCAVQETFGYTMQEAIHYGCIIAAPNKACCPEMLPRACLYNKVSEIDAVLDEGRPVDLSYTKVWDNNVVNILKLMQ